MGLGAAIAATVVAAGCIVASAGAASDPAAAGQVGGAGPRGFRPPAVPLVACDPYFSIWSHADRLTDVPTRHWTGRPHRLTGLVRIDGKTFRVVGDEPKDIPPLKQTSLTVMPTRTIYQFDGQGVALTLTFMTAALPDDLMLLSRPVTYLEWDFRATDGAEHAAAVYLDAAAGIAVNDPAQAVTASRERIAGLVALRAGTKDQPVLAKRGDDLRIDWGFLYAAAAEDQSPGATVAEAKACREAFATGARLPRPDTGIPRPASDAPVLALSFELGKVAAEPAPRWLILAYDDSYSIQYFRRSLRPYWRRGGAEAADMLKAAAAEHAVLKKRCAEFDAELMADLTRAGGERYASMCALAYRQCLAGNKVAADAAGQPLLFPKENTSNGCIGTVDVIYPMAPMFLLLSPSLSKAMLVPVLDYASSQRWPLPFAPHDLGTYPHANGQVYGGGERTEDNQMPVEETANMLILTAALAKVEGSADLAGRYWPILRKWAEYLKAKGFDPENQLCTDDFAGHLAHNVNLSAKAIIALGAYARLCELRGKGGRAEAESYRRLARDFAARWIKEADDGDHFRLAFDRPGTWSQKYNLVWDRILGLDLFGQEVLAREMAYYRKVAHRYGVPLDNRKPYAKLDWSLWTACLTGERGDFDAVMGPVYDFLNDTPSRVPMNDLYWTQDAREVGMHARPVVGGVFLRMLYDGGVWRKWASRDSTKAAGWAPLPTPPKVTVLVPAADKAAATWRYTTDKPGAGVKWFAADFDDSAWKEGKSGFGRAGTPGAIVNTPWTTADIWLRRQVDLPAGTGAGGLAGELADVQLWVHHDEDVEVYVNGVLAAAAGGYTVQYETLPLTPAGRAALRPGKDLFAVHCRQTTGGQYIDLGLVSVQEAK